MLSREDSGNGQRADTGLQQTEERSEWSNDPWRLEHVNLILQSYNGNCDISMIHCTVLTVIFPNETWSSNGCIFVVSSRRVLGSHTTGSSGLCVVQVCYVIVMDFIVSSSSLNFDQIK